MRLYCKTHPKYQGKARPKSKCADCATLYRLLCAARSGRVVEQKAWAPYVDRPILLLGLRLPA